MNKTGYKNIYYQVVKESNLEIIKKIIKELGYYDEETIDKLEFNNKDNLPYFSITVDSSEHLAKGCFSLLDGIFIDIDTIAPEWKGIFYLSILIVRETANARLQPFINADSLKDHELHHLQSIIDHIDRHPDYIEKSMQYNIGSCTIENIKESIEFEVSKIFNNEMHALISDYENGERDCYLHSGGIVTVVTFHNKDEFIQYQLGSYLSSLNSNFIHKFPDMVTEINVCIDKEINKQGENIFGKNTTQKFAIALLKTFSLAQRQGKRYRIDEDSL